MTLAAPIATRLTKIRPALIWLVRSLSSRKPMRKSPASLHCTC
jgi:hypothetical protein